MNINYFFSLALALFFLRTIGFVFCLPNNFDILWKPGAPFRSFPSLLYVFLGLLFVIALILFVKKLSNTSNRIKNYFFYYFLFIYLSYLFFNRSIQNTTVDYLFLINFSSSPFDDIYPNLILDCFFEPPYTAFGLIILSIVYWLCKRKNHIEYIFYFYPILFAFCQFRFNDLILICLISYLITSIIGMKYFNKTTSLTFLSILFFIYSLSIFYSFKFLKIEESYLLLHIETLIIFFIPTFIILFICKKNKNENSIASTWFLLPLINFFLFLPLYRNRTGDCLIAFINFTNTFLVSSNIIVLAIIPFFISFLFEKKTKKSGKILFYSLSTVLFIYYICDIALYYYSQFRINYHTIVWTLNIDNIARATLTTCFNYLSTLSISIILITLVLTIFLQIKGNLIFMKSSTLRSNILLIFLIAHISAALIHLSDPIPEILREPFFELIKSLPVSDFLKNRLSKEEIEKGFIECGIPLKQVSEKTNIEINTKTNVILITLESVHWRYVNMFGNEPKTWPLIGKLKDRMVLFPHIYSCYPESTCGDFAMITGLNPCDYMYLSNQYKFNYKTIFNEFKKVNYNTLFFSSTVSERGLNNLVKSLPLDYKFVFYSKDSNKDNSWEWGYKEEYTTEKIIEYLKNRNKENPYFLWYRTIYPHAPFSLLDSNNKLLFKEKDEYGLLTLVSRYKNALIYLDRVLYDFIMNITELDKKNNQKTLIVMVGDHGEKLGEKEYNGSTSHGLVTTPELQNVACIFIKPESNGLVINKNFGSQIDILPTILDYLKIYPSVKRYEQGQSLYKNDLASRPIYLSSMKSYALVENSYFFEFTDKNSPNFKVTKLGFSEDELKPTYEKISNWYNDEEINNKYQKTNKFFKVQENFLNQL